MASTAAPLKTVLPQVIDDSLQDFAANPAGHTAAVCEQLFDDWGFGAAADPLDPYVPCGGGQPRGLSTAEQVNWMLASRHPDDLGQQDLDDDLMEAVEFERTKDVDEIDLFRASRLRDVLALAEQLEPQRAEWIEAAPLVLKPLVARIHGPLFQVLLDACSYPDRDVTSCLQTGFPFAGCLPACGGSHQTGHPQAHRQNVCA